MNLIPLFKRLSRYPGGKALFSAILGKKIPYTGSIHARIEELDVGMARVSLRDRKSVRNHLHCVHAIALANLAELSSGLSVVAGLPPHMRGILVGFQIEFLKKARGTITAEAHCVMPKGNERVQQELPVELKNSKGDTVCRAKATWLIGPAT